MGIQFSRAPSFLFMAALLPVLSACATTPSLNLATPDSRQLIASHPDISPSREGVASESVTVASILDEISCEIYTTVYVPVDNPTKRKKDDPVKQIRDWTAAVDLTLQVNNDVNITPTLTYTDPVKALNFGFGASAQIESSNQRIFTQTYSINIKTLEKTKPCDRTWPKDFDLAGNLGIGDIISIGVWSLRTSHGAASYAGGGEGGSTGSKSSDGFGQTVQFTLLRNVSGVGPTWSFSVKGPGGLFGASHTDMHELQISFTPPATKPVVTAGGTAPKDAGAALAGHAINQNMLLQQLVPIAH